MWFKSAGQEAMPTKETKHFVLETPIMGPYPQGCEQVQFGMGCFWGAERIFWQLEGVWTTAVGYAGGTTSAPGYKAVCSGQTGHAEVVLVVFDPSRLDFADLLKTFWENHDPTQGNRQGNDRGTQYRSVIFTYGDAQKAMADASAETYAQRLNSAGFGPITTEIAANPGFHFAEDYHQQYLAKNPDGYCGIGGTGVSCPVSPV